MASGMESYPESFLSWNFPGIRRGLRVEATAPDGLVEAVRLDRDDAFVLAVQWHPEWKVAENPFYLGIFREFGAACRARAAHRDEQ